MQVYYFTFFNNSETCLHVLYNSFLLFRVAPSGENMIKYFSFKHSWHIFETELKTLALATILHKTYSSILLVHSVFSLIQLLHSVNINSSYSLPEIPESLKHYLFPLWAGLNSGCLLFKKQILCAIVPVHNNFE